MYFPRHVFSSFYVRYRLRSRNDFWRNTKLVIFDKVDTLLQAKLRKWRQLQFPSDDLERMLVKCQLYKH